MALTIYDPRLENIRLLPEIREKAIRKAKEGYVMALLEAGEISSGKAAEILGVSRLETIEMMNKWGISIFDDSSNGGVTSRSGTGRKRQQATGAVHFKCLLAYLRKCKLEFKAN